MSQKNRKRKLEGEEQSIVDWEQENIFLGETRNEMESMWEVHSSIISAAPELFITHKVL